MAADAPSSRPSRVSVARWSPGLWSVVLDGEPFGPLMPERDARVVAEWLAGGALGYIESPPVLRRGVPSAVMYATATWTTGGPPDGR